MGLLTRAGAPLAFGTCVGICLRSGQSSGPPADPCQTPHICPRTCSKPGWSRVMEQMKGMGLGKLWQSGATCQPLDQGIKCLGMEAVSPGHCSSPLLGVGLWAEAGAPAPDPAHHCCGSLTTHSKGRSLTSANTTGLFLVETATHPPGSLHVLVVYL